MYRKRFGLIGHPLPKNAQGKTFFEKTKGYDRLKRRFAELLSDPGLGLLTADVGIGKTAAIRNLCAQLPRPDYTVIYICHTTATPLDLYRTLAQELGVPPAFRRAQLWSDIKKTLVHMVDERGIQPVIIVDNAHHLCDQFLIDLDLFLNFAFDSRDILTVWLVGLGSLARILHLQQHAQLAMRLAAQVHLDPLDRESFAAFIDHGLRAQEATAQLLSDPAREILFRASRGVPRLASQLLRASLKRAHEREQNFVDEHVVEAAIDELAKAKVSP